MPLDTSSGPRSKAGRAAVLTAVLALAAACSGEPSAAPDGETPVSPPPVSAIPTLSGVEGLVLPSQAYMPTPEQRTLVEDAEEELIAQCMAEFGFPWTPRPSPSYDDNQFDHLYGLASLDAAQTSGYRTLVITEDPRRQPGGQTITYSPAELLVYSGSTNGDPNPTPSVYEGKQIPPGGCSGHARQEVTGADQVDPSLLATSIYVSAFNLSKTDERVIAVISDWSACMKDAGYDFLSPLDISDPTWATPEPSQAEIRAAVTDVTCKQETNLIGVWFSVESAYENALVQRNIEQLTAIKRAWDEAARRAAQILGVPAPQA